MIIKGRDVPIERYVPPLAKPKAIIVDIDGTIAHRVPGPDGTIRSPYDYGRVSEDALDAVVAGIVHLHRRFLDYDVIMCSGRDDSCYDDTLSWLNRYDIEHDALLMRSTEGDRDAKGKLPDWIVKYRIFNEKIRHNYNVKFVLDDRNQVVQMWRELGLPCLQVAPGDF
ncbi:polynucleotide kinase [Gordonia phage Sixama]|uniref:Polynucleotide kinase n=1 Tax=Gordonia phage Sixama TaxID=2653271 RepID=A0A5Q2F0G4_9CAUD|nr:polynucleotide kinase [Gordonia phage Sixama]QGF20232.1 polynucleotide kinase [Gordonia phage Sixama]